MNEQQIAELLAKYKAGTLSPDEKARLETWYINEAAKDKARLSERELAETSQHIRAQLPLKYKQAKQLRLWPRIAAAASVLLFLSAGAYFFIHRQQAEQTAQVSKQDIAPGINQATLVLANGQKIVLDQKGNGQLAKQTGVTITKTKNGEVLYTANPVSGNDQGAVQYNTMLTANGEQYQVVLPDGSQVWLNAASSLKYPTLFQGKERIVQLAGEAYFEVAHNAAMPFKVQTSGQVVEVLGTHFDVNAYVDEPTTKTTLLEGSVKVSVGQSHTPSFLKPGQQSALSGDLLTVSEANIMEAIAWKEGFFRFYGENIGGIMRKLSRWYNIEVSYEGKITAEVYYGKISRFKNISEVLKMLEKAQGVHFKIEGRRVIVRQ